MVTRGVRVQLVGVGGEEGGEGRENSAAAQGAGAAGTTARRGAARPYLRTRPNLPSLWLAPAAAAHAATSKHLRFFIMFFIPGTIARCTQGPSVPCRRARTHTHTPTHACLRERHKHRGAVVILAQATAGVHLRAVCVHTHALA